METEHGKREMESERERERKREREIVWKLKRRYEWLCMRRDYELTETQPKKCIAILFIIVNPIPVGLIFDYFLWGRGVSDTPTPLLKSALIELEKF